MKKQLLLLIAIFTISAVSSFKLKAQQKVYWAKNVLEFSTETTFANQSLEFRATQALGKPNKLPTYGSSACAWQPSMADNSADDFIKVNFDTLMAIRQVSIAENLGQGCIYKIVAFDQQNKEYVLLNKEEPNVNETGKMFCLILPALTTYKVAAIKIYLKTAKVKGFNQIDAIGISQNEKPIKVYIKTADEAPKDVKRETFGDKVNSKGSELAPVLSQDGETLYFTKEIEKKGKKTKKDQDIYASIKDADGNWTKSKSVGGALNDDDSNAALSISADGREIFLLNQYKKDGTKGAGISHAYKTKNGWTTPENIKIENYYNKSAYADFTVSPDGKTLVMSIQRQKFVGKRDLYVSFNKSQNLWSEPVHMGNIINTAENDITPFIGADNKTLYFSTQGYPTFGDNDVFMAYRLDESWTNWSEPENMGYAINTPYWDGFFKIPASSKYAVMTSTSADGTEDSYRVILPEKKKPQPEGVALISGRVLRTDNQQPIFSGISMTQSVKGGKNEVKVYDPTLGNFKFFAPLKSVCTFTPEAVGFMSVSEIIDLTNDEKYREINQDFYLMPLEVGQKINLTSSMFEMGEAKVNPKSYTILDKIIQVMIENPTLEILLEGHTDNQGDQNLNLKLSEERVKNVKNYLIFSKKVDPKRIGTKGWGQTKPIASNLTEDKRKLNRRVEFTITKK